MECVEKTKEVTRAMENKDWDLAVQLRGRSFMRNLETFKSLSKNIPKNARKILECPENVRKRAGNYWTCPDKQLSKLAGRTALGCCMDWHRSHASMVLEGDW